MSWSIDDDRNRSNLLEYYLEADGYHVVHTLTAREAQVALLSQPITVVTLASTLPDGDGLWLLGQLRAAPHTAHVPIIYLARKSEVAAARGLGADTVLPKPVDVPRYWGAVARLARQRRMAAGAGSAVAGAGAWRSLALTMRGRRPLTSGARPTETHAWGQSSGLLAAHATEDLSMARMSPCSVRARR